MRLIRPITRRPGVLATLLVMLLLKGVRGTLTAIAEQAVAFAGSFLDGGSDEIADVLWQTAPLALSVALIVFAILRKWFRPTPAVCSLRLSLFFAGRGWGMRCDTAGAPSLRWLQAHILVAGGSPFSTRRTNWAAT